MRRRRIIFLALGCGILSAVLLLVLASRREPTARGHPLSYWVAISAGYSPPPGTPRTTIEWRQEADVAIQEIGHDGIPFLLTWIDHGEPPHWKQTLRIKAQILPGWIINSGPVRRFLAYPSIDMRWPAALAFRPLGAAAAPAIHELEIRAQVNPGVSGSYALFALSYIGPAAVPSMARVFSNPERAGDKWAMASIMNLGTNARPLIPLLVSYLDHTNEAAAATCAYTLCELRMEPELVIPALTRKLSDPRDAVRVQVSESLAYFIFLASPALPQLTNALSDPNMTVRKNATNAIEIIAGSVPPLNPTGTPASSPSE